MLIRHEMEKHKGKKTILKNHSKTSKSSLKHNFKNKTTWIFHSLFAIQL